MHKITERKLSDHGKKRAISVLRNKRIKLQLKKMRLQINKFYRIVFVQHLFNYNMKLCEKR